MFERFLHYLEFERRYSPHTVVSYKTDLEQFFNYLHDTYNTTESKDITAVMVRSWFVHLMDNHISARSVNRKKTALRSFFKFQQKMGIVDENPMSKILSPKTSKRLPSFIEEDKMNDILDHFPSEGENEFSMIRDRLILEMFYATGMRLTELVNLKEVDVSLYNSNVKVLGKRNKERIIPFNGHLKLMIEEYLQLKRKEYSNDEAGTWFFITDGGKKVYQRLVYRIVNHYLSLITTQEKKSPHTLRHTFATHMLNHGANLNSIKEIMGHANLSATQIYTHNSIEKLKTLYKQAHPKA
ncbi:MAG: tyrosine-type recombinase/integrase [Bacteroidota bacterium]